jgi:hypothetical protein
LKFIHCNIGIAPCLTILDPGSLLAGIAETLEKNLLQLTLKMRADIEVADTKLTSCHKMFDYNSYLIERCEKN